jgi:hypothetical protein
MSQKSNILIPTGFNERDVNIWNAQICKYICHQKMFKQTKFLEYLLNNNELGAYPEKEKAITEESHNYNKLINYCLRWLEQNWCIKKSDTITNEGEYTSTKSLEILCPIIQKYVMPDIHGLVKNVVDVENIIKTENSNVVFEFLNNLIRKKEIDKVDVQINSDLLNKLSKLDLIDIAINNKIRISTLGKIINQRYLEKR